MSQSAINLNLHRKQGEALHSRATEILYGGAAGGGKSHLMRVAAIIWCAMIPGLQVYIFRRVLPDLIKTHIEGPKGFRNLLAPWVVGRLVEIVEDEIRFWNGSKIYLCHCKDEKDRFKYHGAEIHVLLIDELTTFTEVIYRYLRFRVRMVGIEVPEQYRGLFPRILCSSNPGNIGHAWVKRTWIDGHRRWAIWQTSDDEGGMLRQYVPAKLEDNPSMAEDDPLYRMRLRGLGSAELVKAMEDGDWNVIAGAFFDGWSTERHVVPVFTPPAHWPRFGAIDWGSAKPFSWGLYAIADGDLRFPPGHLYAGEIIPRGCLVRFRERYGMTPNQPNVGLKWHAARVAKELRRCQSVDVAKYTVADPSMFKEDGGPSHAETFRKSGLPLKRGDNKRLQGWDQVRYRLEGDEGHDAPPMLLVTDNCVELIRTVPVLQHDDVRLEDLNTDQEDHAGDELRYACMSRPRVRVAPPDRMAGKPKYGTMDWLMSQDEKPRSRYRA
jgi:hypothetical protein